MTPEADFESGAPFALEQSLRIGVHADKIAIFHSKCSLLVCNKRALLNKKISCYVSNNNTWTLKVLVNDQEFFDSEIFVYYFHFSENCLELGA
jgi:hypothetical protein